MVKKQREKKKNDEDKVELNKRPIILLVEYDRKPNEIIELKY